ncbi:MAG: ribulose-phosphate 3-epimerase [Candidatus Omnitrophica bacterium]|nr:ribulose-phosphate 3-epimerase [Candidatus Omnitrophota bacterium]MCF7877338.1 ribulose-phosphate 3-epimerase [Candidatus Omnitrophota bacterium]MCF7892997.1 ribulose-phosphate 3-epimerase [Candidatus Omnitrophota bacterium]
MIVPALLSQDKEKMQEMLNVCSNFADLVQIDIMDGKFVPSQSITAQELVRLKISTPNELHLMVNDPFAWLEPASQIGSKRIIFHLETEIDHKKLITEIKKMEMEAGVSLNPKTNIEKLKPIIKDIDLILFMAVNPGFYGAPFIPEVLDKIKKFKKVWPNKKTAIDGGVKENNFSKIKNIGLNYICIGSAILKSKDPKQAFLNFSRL